MLSRKRRAKAYTGNLRYAGNDQIRFQFDLSLIRALWGRTSFEGEPFRYAVTFDGVTVRLIPIDDPSGEDDEARQISRGGHSTSFPMAHALWSLAPQGRSFEVQTETAGGDKVGAISLENVIQEFRYLRLEPGKPFRTPAAHVQAGLDEERRRRRGSAATEPSVSVPPGNHRYRSIDAWAVQDAQTPSPDPKTVQTQVQTAPQPAQTVNLDELYSPRLFGLDFDTYKELQLAIRARLDNRTGGRATPEESAYMKVYAIARERFESQKEEVTA